MAGNLPPSVPTSFTTDKTDDFDFVAGVGTAVPIANNMEIYGDNGIETSANNQVGDTNVIQVRFSRGETQTIDATTSTAKTITLANNTCLTLQVLVSGLSTDNLGIGGYTTATIKNIAGITSIINKGNIIVHTDVGLETGSFDISVTGLDADLNIDVIGVAGKTINWEICTPGIVST